MYPNSSGAVCPDTLYDFLSRSDLGTKEFLKFYLPFATSIVRKRAGYLPPDLQEEVVQEGVLIVLTRNGKGFDPGRQTVKSYIAYIVRDAIQSVKASYAKPGTPTRKRRINNTQETDAEFNSRPGAALLVQQFDRPEPSESLTDHIDIADERYSAPQIEAHVMVNELAQKLTAKYFNAFVRVHLIGETANNIANDIGVSPATLSRELRGVQIAAQQIG